MSNANREDPNAMVQKRLYKHVNKQIADTRGLSTTYLTI